VHQYELAASPQNSGVQLHPLWDVPDGITAAVEGAQHEFPPVSMLVLENTYMAMSGAPTGADEMRTLVQLGQAGNLRVHVDGARIWNASVATGEPPSALIAGADTAMFCLSKGLGAPVGSVLCGTGAVIAEARAQRRRLGGGMRQAGVIAAAGVYALRHHVDRLADDHANARALARGLSQISGMEVQQPETNLVFFNPAGAGVPGQQMVAKLRERGVLLAMMDGRIRACTHLDVSAAMIEETVGLVRDIVRGA
jgi:threonine aldolase